MNSDTATVFLTFPPRSLGDSERDVVRQWLATATGISAAYVSERRGDDPAYYRRIVVFETGHREPRHLVHCPNGTDVWLVVTLDTNDKVQVFPSLRAALHAIRPAEGVTAEATERQAPNWMDVEPQPASTVSGGPARTIGGMAAALRRPHGVDSAVGAPRRKQL